MEALGMFGVIMAYIWKFRFTYPKFWLPALGMILISQVARSSGGPMLGFEAANFKNCARRFGPSLLGFAAALLSLGLLFGTIRPIGWEQSLGVFAMYLPWGLFQQFLLNGYFLKRFDMSLSPHVAAGLAAVLFCVVHTPNWFLMVVTLVGGYVAVWAYRQHQDFYFLGVAHAMIGSVLFLVVPDSVSHHLNIGPGLHAAAKTLHSLLYSV